ncbi:hypothetical protein LQW54_000692 [Pestalotiopsis sp. IQ-011]
MLYMEKKLVPDMSEFGKLILIYGICRRTKEVCLRSQSQLMSWTPSATIENRAKTYERGETWPPSSNLLSQWRNSACDCLDILHWSANSTALGQWGWEHPTIFHLHLSRLLILTPLRHIQTLATPSPSQDAASQPATDRHARAREYVLRWYLQDQYKARLSVIHAGALLWHCRRYSTRIFLEPYAIYVAALVLWAYSIALEFCQSRGHVGEPVVTSNNTESPNMGNTPASNPTPQPFPEAWDQATTDAMSVVVYLDRPIDDELVQTYIRWGHKMTACLSRVGDIADASAPGSILKEAQRLLNLKDTTRMKDHSTNETSSSGEEVVWGTQEVINIPFFIRGPGVPKGQVQNTFPTTHTDIVPTLFTLAGIPLHDDFDGEPIPVTADILAGAAPKSEHADPFQMTNLYGTNGTIAGWDITSLTARLNGLLLTSKTCKGKVCTRPWNTLHPQGDVQNLRDALGPGHDDFYESRQHAVTFSECALGQILAVEGALEPLSYVFTGQREARWEDWT